MKSTLAACAVCSMLVAVTACSTPPKSASSLERAGRLEQAARQYESTARASTGAASAKAWYRAARLWIDPANPRRSYARGLACFRRVDEAAVGGEIAHETRLWKAALANLVSAQEAAREAESIISAFEDVSRGSAP